MGKIEQTGEGQKLSMKAMLDIERKISGNLDIFAQEITKIYADSNSINSITTERVAEAIRKIPTADLGDTIYLWNAVINGKNQAMLTALTQNLKQCLLSGIDVRWCLLAFMHCVLRNDSQAQFQEAVDIMENLAPRLNQIAASNREPELGVIGRTLARVRSVLLGGNRPDDR